MNPARLLSPRRSFLGPVVSSPAGNLVEVARSPKYAWSGVVASKPVGNAFVSTNTLHIFDQDPNSLWVVDTAAPFQGKGPRRRTLVVFQEESTPSPSPGP